jgi:hypothetical protein
MRGRAIRRPVVPWTATTGIVSSAIGVAVAVSIGRSVIAGHTPAEAGWTSRGVGWWRTSS